LLPPKLRLPESEPKRKLLERKLKLRLRPKLLPSLLLRRPRLTKQPD
jgi:hypothetical protein